MSPSQFSSQADSEVLGINITGKGRDEISVLNANGYAQSEGTWETGSQEILGEILGRSHAFLMVYTSERN